MMSIIGHSRKGKTVEWIKNIRSFFFCFKIVLLLQIQFVNTQLCLFCFNTQIHSIQVFLAPYILCYCMHLQGPQDWNICGYHQLLWQVSDSAPWTQTSQGPSQAGLRYRTYSLCRGKPFSSFLENQMNSPDGHNEWAPYPCHCLLETSVSPTPQGGEKPSVTCSQASLGHALVDSAKFKSAFHRAPSPGDLQLHLSEHKTHRYRKRTHT